MTKFQLCPQIIKYNWGYIGYNWFWKHRLILWLRKICKYAFQGTLFKKKNSKSAVCFHKVCLRLSSLPRCGGVSRSSPPQARGQSDPLPERDSSPQPFAQLLAFSQHFSLFLSACLRTGERPGKVNLPPAGPREPPSSPRFPFLSFPCALAFLSLKPRVHKGLAPAFQLGNRHLFTFTPSPIPTRI